MRTNEVEELKVKLEHLQQKYEDLQEYANFKRDIKSKRTWLKASPFILLLLGFMIWPELFGDSKTRWTIGKDGEVTMTASAFWLLVALPALSVIAHLAIIRYKQWRRSRGE